jgi:hypothetical protein
MSLHSERMGNVYDALRAVGEEFGISDAQWLDTVTEPARAHDAPHNWVREDTNGKLPKSNLYTNSPREVVIFAPQVLLDSTQP